MSERKDESTPQTHDEQGLKTTKTGAWVLADAHSPTPPPTPPSLHTPTDADSSTHATDVAVEVVGVEEDAGKALLADDKVVVEVAVVEEISLSEEKGDAEPTSGDTDLPPVDPPKEGLTVKEWQQKTRHAIKSNLESLANVANDIGLQSLHDEILFERIPSLLEGRFTVVLLGEFNHGKSTVVNALMGENVLPTGITPTTSVITHLVEGVDDSIYVKMRREDGKRTVPADKLDALIRDTTDDSIEYVELHRSNPFLKDGLTLVDTPGVNDISKQKVEITYGYLPRADVIIYVLDATQILKKSEIRFLEEKLLKSKHDHVIFVLGKVDSLTPQEAAEVEHYARKKLAGILGNVQLHPFSARNALEAQLKGETPEAAFVNFRDDVLKLLDDNRAFIVFESGVLAGNRYVTQINQNLSIRKSALTMEIAEVNERIAAVKARYVHAQKAISDTTDFIDSRIQEIIATSVNNLHEFASGFAHSLPREIETSSTADIQTHLPHFIQNAYKDWVEEEGRLLTNRLEALAIEVIEVTNQTMADTLRELRAELGLSGDVDLNVDTLVYDVSIFALGTAGVAALFVNALVGGILTLATPILAYYFHSKIGEKVKTKAKEEGIKAIKEASKAIENQLRESIEAYGMRLKAFVESAGDHLFKQISETLETVRDDMENNPNINELAKRTKAEIERIEAVAKDLKMLENEIEKRQKEVAKS